MDATSRPAGPARPGLRRGVEAEGRHAGAEVLVVLGRVPLGRVLAGLPGARHVFWELAPGQAPWRAVRRLLRAGRTVTLDVADPAQVPRGLARRVEVMVRVPASWRRVSAVKVDEGGFMVGWATLTRWRVCGPGDYAGDRVLWPRRG